MGINTAERQDMAIDADALYRLMTWLSPSFPIGAFSYSHGLETAVEKGLATDRDSFQDWLLTVVTHGTVWADAVLFVDAYRAVVADGVTGASLDETVTLGATMRGTSELAAETTNQGQAFLGIMTAAWPNPLMAHWTVHLKKIGATPAYPIAVAVASQLAGISLAGAIVGYLHATASNLVSAAIRLVPLGQTDGQRIMAALRDPLITTAGRAINTTLDDLGTATPMVDLMSMLHETQYTRLFRS